MKFLLLVLIKFMMKNLPLDKSKFEPCLINTLRIIFLILELSLVITTAVYDKIDLCLDTFPFNGVTTTFEALWKNVPVITKAGYNFNSRCGESILKNASTDNFIAIEGEDVDIYVTGGNALALIDNCNYNLIHVDSLIFK